MNLYMYLRIVEPGRRKKKPKPKRKSEPLQADFAAPEAATIVKDAEQPMLVIRGARLQDKKSKEPQRRSRSESDRKSKDKKQKSRGQYDRLDQPQQPTSPKKSTPITQEGLSSPLEAKGLPASSVKPPVKKNLPLAAAMSALGVVTTVSPEASDNTFAKLVITERVGESMVEVSMITRIMTRLNVYGNRKTMDVIINTKL